jgi:hypothetical protein
MGAFTVKKIIHHPGIFKLKNYQLSIVNETNPTSTRNWYPDIIPGCTS